MYVNQIQEQGEVLIKHLSTDSIPSDALTTKPLHGAPFKLQAAPALSAALQPQRPNHQPAPAPALSAYASAQRLLALAVGL
jgi:hypothetical protein